MKSMNYEGQNVYIGIDVHKKTYAITVYCGGILVKRWSCAACPETLVNTLKKNFRGATIYSAYEAGFSGFTLHRYLKNNEINSIVINAASIEVSANDRVKNDKRDSKKIAELLAAGRLKGIYIPTEKEELRRNITRSREQLVRQRTSIANQIKMKLHHFGLVSYDNRKMISSKYLKEIEAWHMPDELIFALKLFMDTWRHLTDCIAKIESRLKEMAAEESTIETIYRSVPGIGLISSRTLAHELGDMSRFANERQLFSFTGLTPCEFSSGDAIRRGHITRQGASRLRSIMTEVAWRAIASDPSLNHFYQKLKATRGAKRAIVAVARKMIGRIRACFRHNTIWEMKAISEGLANATAREDAVATVT